MPTSQNGFPANDVSLTKVWSIPGTERTVRLKRGACGKLLVDLAAKFHRAVEPIDDGQLDDWGYAERPIRGSSTELSNHASGTAIDLNATRHPLGKRGTFTPIQVANIHALLEQYDGCIRWGGDYSGRPDEMHFEINRPLEDVSRVAQGLRAQEDIMATKEELAALLDEKLAPIQKELDEIRTWAKSARAQALAAHTEGIEANAKLDAHAAAKE